MKPFSIAALQLDLDYSDNFDLVVEKTYQVAKRYPWVQMIVLSELAVGGSSRSLEFSLEKQLPKFQDIAKELGVWYIPGSFYDHSLEEVKNIAPVISPNGDLVATCININVITLLLYSCCSGHNFFFVPVTSIRKAWM